ncbi:uncharacterized protein LOC114280537 [Camellia sinensis]|uniref:RING-CH-type domain-containing protein n=1 Tax=Camellia sinensis var. sinensis TaxID=542762 RepID=A0A4S4E307_CAMSN|nr:uncharacterized protein LOC114280537 [Camellia sinensis]THG10271.1 hypothetical protein TEA_028238 [Camellia sinensis var. sinensis]
MSHIDLECGGDGGDHRLSSPAVSDGDEGSFHSQFYSINDGSCDDYGSDLETNVVSDSLWLSSAVDSDYSADIENGVREIKVHLGRVERDCRICQLSLESTKPESGIAIELGCSCKDDLAAAHKSCAEAWFKIKGNKTCEICNSVARNVLNANDIESTQQTNETNVTATNAVSAPPSAEMRRCLNGHRLVNFLLACMVFAFVISWLFHFNIQS